MPDESLPTLDKSVESYEPPDPYKKLRDAYRKKHPTLDPGDTMLELRPAGEWITRGGSHRVRPAELLGPLWREGEVAVLFGDTASGKSILAVQIGESIACGKSYAFTREERRALTPKGVTLTRKPQKVLFLDFELTARQFAERYSVPSPIPGKLPIRHRFSRKFIRSEVKWDGHIPEAFKGDLTKFLRHSVAEAIGSSGARVVIIDNISYLTKHTSSNAATAQVMKMLKLWAATSNLSILVLAHSKSSPPYKGGVAAALGGRGGSLLAGKPITLSDLPARSLADLADSVFAIANSTYGPDIRYIKHLKSRSAAPVHDQDNVLTYQIGRLASANPQSASSPPAGGGVAEGQGGGSPHSEGPFLGLTLLGTSSESDHLRNYAAEAQRVFSPPVSPRVSSPHVSKGSPSNPKSKIQNSKSIVDMFLSREYWRYLER